MSMLARLCLGLCFMVCVIASGFLEDLVQSDTMAIRTRLEAEKAKRLLIENDLEMLMLKVAKLERKLGDMGTDDRPMTLALSVADNEERWKSTNAEVERLQRIVSAGYGSVYVRWGRTGCPENGTDTVYRGFVGGGHYSHSGAAASPLCLPEEPIWDQFTPGVQSPAEYLYGAEYEFDARDRVPYFGREIHDHDVPCAVCRAQRSTVLMVPGRNVCYDGWHLEYRGYLSAGHHAHTAASKYVCIDKEPESISGGTGSQNGYLFYFVEPICGSLKCPPYIEGQELSCAVCSK